MQFFHKFNEQNKIWILAKNVTKFYRSEKLNRIFLNFVLFRLTLLLI